METIVIILLAAAAVAIIGAGAAGWAPLLSTTSAPQPIEAAAALKVSVVVYAPTDEEEIRRWLEMALNQDYPDYEVIIVTQASAENARMMADHFQNLHNRLRITFINPEARGLSMRKLALTIGIKAAEGDIVLTTSTSVEIPSEKWLSEMAAPFASEDTAMALGAVRPDFRNMGSGARGYRKFLWITTTARWISAALHQKAYRGQGDNLAFRRQLFFDHKGYADSLLLKCGDDDIFVSSIAADGAASVVVSPDSLLQEAAGVEASMRWQESREQHRFTSRLLPSGPARLAGTASFCRWAVPACCSAAALVSPLPLNMGIAGGLLLLFWIAEIIIYSRAAKRLLTPGAAILAPYYGLWRPIGNVLFGMRCRRRHCTNYS